MTEPAPHDWLPASSVRSWLKISDTSDQLEAVELCRTAAADYCERQRRDLFWSTSTDPVTGVETTVQLTPGDSVVMAGILAAARLFARMGSPAGLASFGEFGAVEVLRLDPDVSRLLGVGRYAPPVVG